MFSQVHYALSDSFSRVLTKLAVFLPGLLALVVAVALLTLLGAGLSWGIRAVLVRMKFDERVARDNSAGVTDWAPAHSPTLLVSRIVFWGCVLLGLAIGISAYDAAGTSDLAPFLLPYLAHSVGALIILIAGTILARYLSRSVLISAVNAKLTYARPLSLGVKWLVLVFTGAMMLDHLQIGGLIVELGFGILFGGIVLALALAIGLGSRDLVARSIERTADRAVPIDRAAERPTDTPRTLRHF
ncbi:hypothetical protein Terro_0851 [Terriglobus roseus DSM 18391]|uniref:Uncharacterized protein n=1 Tax=Terriglobus roseus (strain DSM 18391 / NRRL B-41598 / KBS 63) TaxID=926566 RepID=I3ZD60_TERRK|nr:hypothetical protein [Terriglobus roseus]AFL87178.1 hypothetical protein Terro_0851 [Terriglobus roseus DSM 18391]